jgi:hypothetical protein
MAKASKKKRVVKKSLTTQQSKVSVWLSDRYACYSGLRYAQRCGFNLKRIWNECDDPIWLSWIVDNLFMNKKSRRLCTREADKGFWNRDRSPNVARIRQRISYREVRRAFDRWYKSYQKKTSR